MLPGDQYPTIWEGVKGASGGEAEVLKEGLKDIRYFCSFAFCHSRFKKEGI